MPAAEQLQQPIKRLNSVASPMPSLGSSDSLMALERSFTNSLQTSICHGMVKEHDFEFMVPAQWWKTVFADALYLKTDGDVVEDPKITQEEIRMLEHNPYIYEVFEQGKRSLPLEDSPKVLDLCCGQGRHTLLLAERYPGLRLHGHDQSSFLISLARERALHLTSTPQRHHAPLFTVGDCRYVPHDSNEFDFVMIMGNSFGYFSARDNQENGSTDEDGDRQVLQEINRVLKPGGRMVLDLADGDYMRDNFSPRSWEWIDDQTFVCRERTLSADKKRLHSREVVVVVTRGVVRDQFYSERLYGREELVDLLREAGFDIETADETVVDEGLNTVTAAKELSQRKQDLGMMEQRLLIFAKKVRAHPRLRDHPVTKVPESAHPFLSAENAQAVREWLERLSPDMFTQNLKITNPFMSDNNFDLLRVWIKRLQKSIQSQEVDEENTPGLHPSVYHLLPPPPFPKDQLAVILGDTSIPCREKLNGVWNKEDFVTRKKLVQSLLNAGFSSHQITILENHKELVGWLATKPSIFALNLCDEGFMNDANKELHVPSMLEACDIEYTGAGPVSLGVCYDKGLVNSVASKIGIPTPRETYIILPESLDLKDFRVELLEKIIDEKEASGEICYPSFVKPMKGDNSLGITGRSIVHNRSDMTSYIEYLIQTYSLREFICQEFLTGTEYSVGMIGNPETGFHFFPILQVDYSKIIQEGLEPILGWESKWDPESPYWSEIDYVVAPKIPEERSNKDEKPDSSTSRLFQSGGLTVKEEADLKQWCIALFERFGCRDYARFDWRADREIKWSASGEIKNVSSVKKPDPVVVEQTSSSSSAEEAQHANEKSEEGDDNLSSNSESSSDTNMNNGSITTDSGRGSQSSEDRRAGFDETPTNVDEKVAESVVCNSSRPVYRTLKLLEVNPNPGWCWDGKLAKMAAFEGKSYEDLIKSVIWASWDRVYGKYLRNST